MAKRATVLEKVLQGIDAKIATLQEAKAVVLALSQQTPKKAPRKPAPAPGA